MKKNLIALAVASAVSAPAAFAATANVDVYGKLHVSVSSFNDQGTGINDVQVSSNASRLGFKGSEDLGGGLKAIWQIESLVNLDEQSGNLGGRNSFLGLAGGFGTVLVGTHDTPLKLVGRKVDLFPDTIADTRNVTGGASDTRAKNVVAYISPSFSGLGFAAAYVSDFNGTFGPAGDASNQSVYNLNATYANGPLFLGLGYGDGDGHQVAGLGKQWRAAAGYTFGNFKVVGQYDSLDDDNTLNPGGIAGDRTDWMAGVAYTMGNIVLKANYMDADWDNTTADPQQWTVGADYKLSKRSSVYALYAKGENVTLGGGVASTDRISSGVAGGDISAFSVGMIHSF
ncbi:MAG: porin [Thiobacillus sp.]